GGGSAGASGVGNRRPLGGQVDVVDQPGQGVGGRVGEEPVGQVEDVGVGGGGGGRSRGAGLKMWRSRPPAAASTRSASRATTSKGARSTAGSRLPWIPLAGPIRRQASSSGPRQSTLTR